MNDLIQTLRKNGYRITSTREELIAQFFKADTPLSAMELLTNLARNNILVNKTTVYREIDFLLEKGIITEVKLSLDEKKYELSQKDHHHHLICENCGEIQRYDNCLVADIEATIKQNAGFIVKDHSMEFYGVCIGCK